MRKERKAERKQNERKICFGVGKWKISGEAKMSRQWENRNFHSYYKVNGTVSENL